MKLHHILQLILFSGFAVILGCATPDIKESEQFSTFKAGETYHGQLITQDVRRGFITWHPENSAFSIMDKSGLERIYPANSVREVRYRELTKDQKDQLNQLKQKIKHTEPVN